MTAPRWLRFNLRTLFVVVTTLTVVLGWIAYQLHWIRQRHEVLRDSRVLHQVFLKVPTRMPPWSLRLLGESPMRFDGNSGSVGLSVDGDTSDEEVSRIRALFPELNVWDHRAERQHDTAPGIYGGTPSSY